MYFPKVSPAIYLTLSSALLVPALANADQVILDDLIVDGSICAGLDCVNGESFGFDTLRLKENNLRIKAQDTSTTASFPSRDWQITFNDSSNGGANKFAIDDVDGGRTPFTIEAGAPSHSLYVDDGGRLGLGTSTPVVDIHVKSGNTPTLRLEQDGSSGFTPQTWDVAGNEANFFVRDASNGSTLPFRIFPDAPSNALTIEGTTGDIGVGTSSPEWTLDVVGRVAVGGPTASFAVQPRDETGGEDFHIYNPNNSFRIWSASTGEALVIDNAGKMGIKTMPDVSHDIKHANGAYLTATGVWTDASSRSLKENIKNLSYSDAEDALMELNPITFNYILDPEDSFSGFIAEDVPELVAAKDRKGLAPMDIVAVLTKVVQSQQVTIGSLNRRLASLESKEN